MSDKATYDPTPLTEAQTADVKGACAQQDAFDGSKAADGGAGGAEMPGADAGGVDASAGGAASDQMAEVAKAGVKDVVGAAPGTAGAAAGAAGGGGGAGAATSTGGSGGILGAVSNAGQAIVGGIQSAGAAVANGVSVAFNGAVSLVASGITAVTGAASTVASTVATGLVVTTLSATCITAGAAGMVVTSVMGHQGILEDCSVAYASEQAANGWGENDIPEGMGDVFSYSALWTDGWYWGDSSSNIKPVAASALKNIYDQWLAKSPGECDEWGTLTYDGKLLVATTTKYGAVGDNVVFYLDDGTAIDCILFDVKNPDDAGCNEWGHMEGRCVLELEQKPRDLGGPGTNAGASNNHPDWAGKRVASWTNNGHWAGISLGGALDDVAAGVTGATNDAHRAAASNCRKMLSNVDNSNAAAAAASFAWPTGSTGGMSDGNDGTDLWKTVRDAVWEGMDGISTSDLAHYRSCDVTVSTALRWSGTDMSYPQYSSDGQFAYCIASEKWEEVTAFQTEGAAALLPGDVLCKNGHTGIFTGHDAIVAVHGDDGAGRNCVAGSLRERSPGCEVQAYSFPPGEYRAFRCVQPDHDQTYASVGR